MARAADFVLPYAPDGAGPSRWSLYPPNVGLENSLTAFRTAVDLGFTHLETDVHATSDGEVVAFHDDHLDRVSDTRGAIATLPWATVRRVRIGDASRSRCSASSSRPLPSARFNIDIKAAGAVTPLGASSRSTPRTTGSASALLRHPARRFPAARPRSGGHRGGPGRHGRAPVPPAAAERCAALPGAVLQIPETTPLPGGRQLTVVTEALLTAAHALGKQVHVWTIDDPQMTRLLDLGADGIVTDRPDLLKVLQARGQWHVPGAGS